MDVVLILHVSLATKITVTLFTIISTYSPLAAEKSRGTIDRVTTDSPYNEARCSGASLYLGRYWSQTPPNIPWLGPPLNDLDRDPNLDSRIVDWTKLIAMVGEFAFVSLYVCWSRRFVSSRSTSTYTWNRSHIRRRSWCWLTTFSNWPRLCSKYVILPSVSWRPFPSIRCSHVMSIVPSSVDNQSIKFYFSKLCFAIQKCGKNIETCVKSGSSCNISTVSWHIYF